MIVRIGVLVTAVALVVTGCSGGDSDPPPNGSPSGSPSGQQIVKGTAVDAVPDGAPLIDQEKLEFVPETLEATASQTIYFKNSESPVHTVNVNRVNISGNMRRGDVIAWKAPRPGQYQVTCDYHPQMKATIIVKE